MMSPKVLKLPTLKTLCKTSITSDPEMIYLLFINNLGKECYLIYFAVLKPKKNRVGSW